MGAHRSSGRRERRHLSSVFAVLVLLVAIFSGASTIAQADASPVRLIIELAPEPGIADTNFAAVDALRQGFASAPPVDLTVVREIPSTRFVAVEVSPDQIDAVTNDPRVLRVEIDHVISIAETPAQDLINLPYAAERGHRGDEDIRVAVLDTGIDSNHPALAGKVAVGGCFIDPAFCPAGTGLASVQDDHGHGTAVASIIGGTGAGGVEEGVAPGVTLVAYKVLDANGLGFTSELLAALTFIYQNSYSSANHVDIVNLSLSGDTPGGVCDSTLVGGLVNSLWLSRQTPVVAAAGNAGSASGIQSPACASSAISVGAVYTEAMGPRSYGVNGGTCTDASPVANLVPCYSNSTGASDSDGNALLDVLAPGDCTPAAALGGGTTACFGGTSAAAAHASGVLALLLGTGLSDEEAARRLKVGLPVTDGRNGVTRPRVDIAAAMSAAGATLPVDAANPACTSDGPTWCTIDAAIRDASPFDTIQIAAGTYNEQFDFSKDLTITGAGMDLTIIDGGIDNNETLDADSNLHLSNLTLIGNSSNRSTLWLHQGADEAPRISTLTNIAIRDSAGSGVSIDRRTRAEWTGGVVSGNAGRGISVNGSLTLTDVTVTGNNVLNLSPTGGGIDVGHGYTNEVRFGADGHLTIHGGAISHNAASRGGGLNNRGVATLNDVTLNSNRYVPHHLEPTHRGGSGIANVAATYRAGGGADPVVLQDTGILTLNNVTVVGAEQDGLLNQGTATIRGGEFSWVSPGPPIHWAGGSAIRNLPDGLDGAAITPNTGILHMEGTVMRGLVGVETTWLGGALENRGTATLVDVDISDYTVAYSGAGIYNGTMSSAPSTTGSLTVIGGAIRSSSADRGAAVMSDHQSRTTLTDVLIESNTSVQSGAITIGGTGTVAAQGIVLLGNCTGGTGDACLNGPLDAADAWGHTTGITIRDAWWGCVEGPPTCGSIAGTVAAPTWTASVTASVAPEEPQAGSPATVAVQRINNDGDPVEGSHGLVVTVDGEHPLAPTFVPDHTYTYTGTAGGTDTVTAEIAFGSASGMIGLRVTVDVTWDPPITPAAPSVPSGGGGGGGGAPAAATAPRLPTTATEPGVEVPLTNVTEAKTSSEAPATATSTDTRGSRGNVVVPPNAMPPDTSIVLGAIDDLASLQAQAPPPNRASIVLGFQITATGPDGEPISSDFGAPVELEFTVPAGALPPGALPADLVVAFWDGTEWVEIEATATPAPGGGYVFRAATDHFTLFAVIHRPALSIAGTFSVPLAARGFTLVAWSGGAIDGMIAAGGGRIQSIWTFRDGRAYGYRPDVVEFVNRAFRDLFPGDFVPAGSLFLVQTGP